MSEKPISPLRQWVARQITQAFPWDEVPRYLIRDRDRIYGSVVTRRLRSPPPSHFPLRARAKELARTEQDKYSRGTAGGT